MDSFETTQQAIDAGKAWHVGVHPGASQYIFMDENDAREMAAHLNTFPGGAVYRVRPQSEINAEMAKRRGR